MKERLIECWQTADYYTVDPGFTILWCRTSNLQLRPLTQSLRVWYPHPVLLTSCSHVRIGVDPSVLGCNSSQGIRTLEEDDRIWWEMPTRLDLAPSPFCQAWLPLSDPSSKQEPTEPATCQSFYISNQCSCDCRQDRCIEDTSGNNFQHKFLSVTTSSECAKRATGQNTVFEPWTYQ